jgi:hypothetical protein
MTLRVDTIWSSLLPLSHRLFCVEKKDAKDMMFHLLGGCLGNMG